MIIVKDPGGEKSRENALQKNINEDNFNEREESYK